MERFFEAHARLKSRIHSFKMPIRSRAGLAAVKVVYFTVPCLIGWAMLEWTNTVREENLGANGEKLRERQRAWAEEQGRVLVRAQSPTKPTAAATPAAGNSEQAPLK